MPTNLPRNASTHPGTAIYNTQALACSCTRIQCAGDGRRVPARGPRSICIYRTWVLGVGPGPRPHPVDHSASPAPAFAFGHPRPPARDLHRRHLLVHVVERSRLGVAAARHAPAHHAVARHGNVMAQNVGAVDEPLGAQRRRLVVVVGGGGGGGEVLRCKGAEMLGWLRVRVLGCPGAKDTKGARVLHRLDPRLFLTGLTITIPGLK